MMQTAAAQPVTFKNVMNDHITRIPLMNAAAGAYGPSLPQPLLSDPSNFHTKGKSQNGVQYKANIVNPEVQLWSRIVTLSCVLDTPVEPKMQKETSVKDQKTLYVTLASFAKQLLAFMN